MFCQLLILQHVEMDQKEMYHGVLVVILAEEKLKKRVEKVVEKVANLFIAKMENSVDDLASVEKAKREEREP